MVSDNRETGLRMLAILCGVAVALLGFVVLFAWYRHDLRLLHVRPQWVAMAFNTALGFFLAGISLTASASKFPRIALVGAVYGLVVGPLTMAEYLVVANIPVDEIFFHSYTRAGVTAPARMAFCTALSFVLSGIVFVAAQQKTQGPRNRTEHIIAVCGALIAAMGVVALSGYFTGVTLTYMWGQLTRMAVHTSLGFIVLGLGAVVLAFSRLVQRNGRVGELAPALIGLAAATGTVCVWQALVVANNAQRALIITLERRTFDSRLHSIADMQSALTTGALAMGLVLALLLAVAVRLFRTAGRRSERLAAEVVERQAAQVALQHARDELEERVVERTTELEAANAEISAAHDELSAAAQAQRTFLRDVLASVTEGKLRLCFSEDDLPKPPQRFGDLAQLTPDNIRGLRCRAEDAANKVGLTEERTCDLLTAVGEAAMNAVVHGGGGEGFVYIEPGEAVQIWVRDHGAGIEMASIHQATLRRGFTTAGSFGHGFWMILKTVDTLWLLTGPTGTTVVLEQRRVPPEPFWMQVV